MTNCPPIHRPTLQALGNIECLVWLSIAQMSLIFIRAFRFSKILLLILPFECLITIRSAVWHTTWPRLVIFYLNTDKLFIGIVVGKQFGNCRSHTHILIAFSRHNIQISIARKYRSPSHYLSLYVKFNLVVVVDHLEIVYLLSWVIFHYSFQKANKINQIFDDTIINLAYLITELMPSIYRRPFGDNLPRRWFEVTYDCIW